MISEYRDTLWALRGPLDDYERSVYAGKEVRRAVRALARLHNILPKKKIPEKYYPTMVEVAKQLDVLYGGVVGYRKMHEAETLEKTYIIEIQRLKDLAKFGVLPVFEAHDEARIRAEWVFKSEDPIQRFERAMKVMEPFMMDYEPFPAYLIMSQFKDLKSHEPTSQVYPAGKILRYYESFTESDKHAEQYLKKLVELHGKLNEFCEHLGVPGRVTPINTEAGMEAVVLTEYLNEETERMREVYIKLVADGIARMV